MTPLLLSIALTLSATPEAPSTFLTAEQQVTTQRADALATKRVGRGLTLTGLIVLTAASLGEGLNVGITAWNGPSGLLAGPLFGVVGAIPILGAGAFMMVNPGGSPENDAFMLRSAFLLAAQVAGIVTSVVGLVIENNARVPVVSVSPVKGGAVMTAAIPL